MEVLSGFFVFFVFLFYSFDKDFIKLVLLYLISVPVSIIDIKHYVIKTTFVLAGFFLFSIYIVVFEFEFLSNYFIGCVIGFIIFFIIHLVYKNKLGFGDVRLVAMLGFFCGIEGVLWTIFFGSIFGILYAIFRIVVFKDNVKVKIPYAPFLCFASILYLFFGDFVLILLM